MWTAGNLAIRDDRLYIENQSIPLADILSVTDQVKTVGTPGSTRAFHFMVFFALGALVFLYRAPGLSAVLIVYAAISWFFAWFLRRRCWFVHLNRNVEQRMSVAFSDVADAKDFLGALTTAKGALQFERSPGCRRSDSCRSECRALRLKTGQWRTCPVLFINADDTMPE